MKLEAINSVIRPKDVVEKMQRIDAYVRLIRGKSLPDDAHLTSNNKIINSFSADKMAVLIKGMDSHLNENDDGNFGLRVSIIIGLTFLLLFLCLTCWNCRKARAMSKHGGNRLLPVSARSEKSDTPFPLDDSVKIDDIW